MTALLEARFAKRAAGPREALRIPAVEWGDRHALARRLDEPAVAHVDAHVVDLTRRGVRPDAEEERVRRLEVLRRDPFRCGHLATHLIRRPSTQHRCEVT